MPDETSVVAPDAAPGGSSRVESPTRRFDMMSLRRSIPAGVVCLMVVAYTAYFAELTLEVHHGLGTSTYDSALYDQGIWLMSRFQTPFVTLMGRNLMGDHTSLILVLLVPLYWLFPAAGTMFFVQAFVIGAGAIPIFLYARRRLDSSWLAIVMAAAYLIHPAVSFTNLENFHPDAFLGLLVGAALYAALERKWRMYALFVVLSLLVKEDVSLVIVPLGIWVAIVRDRRIGLLTVFGSIAFMLVAMFVVMRSLIGVPTRNGWRIPFGGMAGLIRTAASDPMSLVDHLRSDGRPWYVWQLTAPMGLMFLRKPGIALISAVVIFTNVLSVFWYQFQIGYHYSLIIVPGLVMGTTYALGSIRMNGKWNRRQAVLVLAICSTLTAYAWAPLPFTRYDMSHWASDHPVAQEARDIIADIPANGVVAAHYQLTPHLAHRAQIYMFPNPFRVSMYGPDVAQEGTRIDDLAESVEFLVLQVNKSEESAFDFAVIRPAFELVDSNTSWELWRRIPEVPLPPLP